MSEIPPPPPNNFRPGPGHRYAKSRGEARNGLSASEAEVLRRRDAGEPLETILVETGINKSVAQRALGFASESGTLQMQGDLRSGSASLRDAIFAASAERSERRRVAGKFANVSDPLPVDRPSPIAEFIVAGVDHRPEANGRNPCGRCGTRGDIGCAHYRASTPREATA